MSIHEIIELAIVEPPDHQSHRMTHQRVIKTRKLPRAKVSGQHQDALPARLRREIVLRPFCANPALRVFRGVARHAAKLDQLPAKMAIHAAQNLVAFDCWEFRQRQFEIPLAHAAQAAKPVINSPCQPAGKPARYAPWHPSQNARHGQNEPVF